MTLDMHLKQGATHVCRAWAVIRRDGVTLGFTDHDRDLEFDGVVFRAATGMSALAVQQSTGLSIDNTEALGTLSAESIQGADIAAGRFDGAEVKSWLVRWDAVENRVLQFSGRIGAIVRSGSGFSAELRGLTEQLNTPGGRIFHRLCPAVLGDGCCGVDVTSARFAAEATVVAMADDGGLSLSGVGQFAQGWFAHGAVSVLSGEAQGITAVVKTDTVEDGVRRIALWAPIGSGLSVGDRVRLVAGCDKRFETCRAKFQNAAAFQGFPHIPGEDWLMSVPHTAVQTDGGSMNR